MQSVGKWLRMPLPPRGQKQVGADRGAVGAQPLREVKRYGDFDGVFFVTNVEVERRAAVLGQPGYLARQVAMVLGLCE